MDLNYESIFRARAIVVEPCLGSTIGVVTECMFELEKSTGCEVTCIFKGVYLSTNYRHLPEQLKDYYLHKLEETL